MRDAALECPVSGEDMKTKMIVLTLVLCFVAAAVCFADDAFTGTWKLNEAKSKMAPNAPKNNTVVYEAVGNNVKITVDGIGNDGKPTHDEWTGKFGGKDYAVTGNPNSDMRSYTKIDDHTLGFNVQKGGKVTTRGRVVVAADGKSRTVTPAEPIRRARNSPAPQCTTSSELFLVSEKPADQMSKKGPARQKGELHPSCAITPGGPEHGGNAGPNCCRWV